MVYNGIYSGIYCSKCVCVHLDELHAENTIHCWLYSLIIVYVTNKAQLSIIIYLI